MAKKKTKGKPAKKAKRSPRKKQKTKKAGSKSAAKEICVVCAKRKKGYPVTDDAYIVAVRSLKEKLNMKTGNVLVVCEECVPKYKEKRARFEKYLAIHAFFALAGFLLALYLSPSLNGFLGGSAFALFVLVLSLLTYFPGAEIEEEK